MNSRDTTGSQNRRLIRLGSLSLALVVCGSPALAADAPEVTATIQVQPAEVYVLGDDIPLIWNFTNQSTNSLAMLW